MSPLSWLRARQPAQQRRDFRGGHAALERVAFAFSEAGLGPLACCESPIHGHKGNVEYLLLGRKGSPTESLDLAGVVRDGVVARMTP